MPRLPSFAALRTRFPALARLGGAFARRRIPYIQQMEAADCAAACLAMVLGYHGRETALREVREVLGAGRSGVNARELLEAALRFGLRTRGVQLDVEDLHNLPTGAVLHWGFEHFVVLEKLGRSGIRVIDPALGPRLVRLDEFREQFTGVALIFEPTEGFERRRVRRKSLTGYLLRLLAHRDVLIRTIVLSVVLQVLALGLPILIGVIVDRVVPRRDHDLLALLAVGFVFVVVFQIVTLLLRSYLMNYLKMALDAQLSLGFVDHLADLPLGFFVQRTSGDLLARFESNRDLRQTLTGATLSTLLDGSLVFAYLGLLLVVSAPIGGLVVLLGLLQVVLFLAMRRPTRMLAAQELEAQSRSQGHLVEMLAGMETLKSMGAEKRSVERWSHRFVDELNVTLARARLGSIAGALTSGLTMGSPLAILLLGAWQVIQGQLSLGMMLTLNALAAGFLTPLSNLVAVALQLQEARGHIERIEDVLDAAPEADPERPLPGSRLQGGIEVDGVSFRYGAREPWVVRDVSVSIAPGQKIAIVGRSGAGKSTLARLLVGLYRPESGRITFDGVDLASLDLRAVRKQIGVVTQDARVFGMSIRDNLALAEHSADFDRLVRAARLAEIHDEIEAMPLGYNTPLTDGGASLSGGQRQRIALARALIGEPAILLLDEATSDLDTVTESRLMANLARLLYTRIVIAHRLSTVADADLILVLSGGQLVEAGGHAQLLAKKGHYAELVSAQLAAENSDPPDHMES